ncbi:translation initiation factor IF-2-like [Molothrus ater]|uniref:translation initiation factor IF-2-like n=1 Tax=Molothrus ater TaxID=84834 RepID=UPI0023E8A76A|nr:translation initiation factor IF-2-like [Molothrus ater]
MMTARPAIVTEPTHAQLLQPQHQRYHSTSSNHSAASGISRTHAQFYLPAATPHCVCRSFGTARSRFRFAACRCPATAGIPVPCHATYATTVFIHGTTAGKNCSALHVSFRISPSAGHREIPLQHVTVHNRYLVCLCVFAFHTPSTQADAAILDSGPRQPGSPPGSSATEPARSWPANPCPLLPAPPPGHLHGSVPAAAPETPPLRVPLSSRSCGYQGNGAQGRTGELGTAQGLDPPKAGSAAGIVRGHRHSSGSRSSKGGVCSRDRPRGCSGADRAAAWIGPTWLTAADPAETKPGLTPAAAAGAEQSPGSRGWDRRDPPSVRSARYPRCTRQDGPPAPSAGTASGAAAGQAAGTGTDGPGQTDRDRRTGTDGPCRSRHRGWGSRERVEEQTGMDEVPEATDFPRIYHLTSRSGSQKKRGSAFFSVSSKRRRERLNGRSA